MSAKFKSDKHQSTDASPKRGDTSHHEVRNAMPPQPAVAAHPTEVAPCRRLVENLKKIFCLGIKPEGGQGSSDSPDEGRQAINKRIPSQDGGAHYYSHPNENYYDLSRSDGGTHHGRQSWDSSHDVDDMTRPPGGQHGSQDYQREDDFADRHGSREERNHGTWAAHTTEHGPQSGTLVRDNIVTGDPSKVVIGEGNWGGRRTGGRVTGNRVLR